MVAWQRGLPVHPARQQQWPVTGSQPSAWLQSQRSLQFSPNVPSCGEKGEREMTRPRLSEVLTLLLDVDDKTEPLPNKDEEKLGLEHCGGTFYNWGSSEATPNNSLAALRRVCSLEGGRCWSCPTSQWSSSESCNDH